MNRRTFLALLGFMSAGAMLRLPALAAGSGILVAYFSATGTTKNAAEALAQAVGGDTYAITPEQAYTAADLDWHDKSSRSSLEMADPSSRPKIAGPLPDMGKYGTVFIGYPIWWGIAPRIVQTFVEQCSLNGKTAVPFCTSGGSQFAQSAELLARAATGAKWLPGRRLRTGESKDALLAWAKELGVK